MSYNVDRRDGMAQKRVLSMRLPDSVRQTIERMARRERRTPAEMAALLLEEKVRERTHPLILFRDTAVGRQASVRGTRLLVWHVMMVARDLEMDPAKVAEHLQWSLPEIQAAFRYTQDYPEEIWGEVEANDAVTLEDLQRTLPGVRAFVVDGD
jgi:uncharacterized protein (DUF433 family)